MDKQKQLRIKIIKLSSRIEHEKLLLKNLINQLDEQYHESGLLKSTFRGFY